MNIDSQYHVTTIILAGGKSTRMGRDKALIPMGGV
ncbi:MAG: NTP transferase domain-containing protein, partial [Dolichospermum sp.]